MKAKILELETEAEIDPLWASFFPHLANDSHPQQILLIYTSCMLFLSITNSVYIYWPFPLSGVHGPLLTPLTLKTLIHASRIKCCLSSENFEKPHTESWLSLRLLASTIEYPPPPVPSDLLSCLIGQRITTNLHGVMSIYLPTRLKS